MMVLSMNVESRLSFRCLLQSLDVSFYIHLQAHRIQTEQRLYDLLTVSMQTQFKVVSMPHAREWLFPSKRKCVVLKWRGQTFANGLKNSKEKDFFMDWHANSNIISLLIILITTFPMIIEVNGEE